MTARCRRLVILPGLDGTGHLLTDFTRQLECRYKVDVITYPTDEPKTYDELLHYIRQYLPAENYILVGESFSGPLALRIASESPLFLRAVVLGASFGRFDSPLKALPANFIDWVPLRAVPFTMLNFLLLGGKATDEDRQRLNSVLQSVHPQVLKLRVKEALKVDLFHDNVHVTLPLLYLRGSADRLVSGKAAELVSSLAKNTSIRDIAAPHFLFQTEPRLCAEAIMDFDRTIFPE
jgi:pimeloyl-[acyl-carrier protein] methyl ester esterase